MSLPLDPAAADIELVGARTWVETVDQGVRIAYLIIALLGVASTVALVPLFFPRPSSMAVFGLTLLGLGQLLILLVLWRLPRTGWVALLIALLTGVGLVVAVCHMTPVPELSDTWWPRALLVTTPGFLIAIDRRGWVLGGLLILTNAVLHAQAWQANPTLPTMTRFQEIAAELGQFVAYATVAFVAVRVTGSAARDADGVVARSRALREAASLGQAQEHQRKEADRFVHDEVLHTLRMVAMERSLIPAAPTLEAVTRLRRILELQQRAPDRHGLVEELCQVTRDLGIHTIVSGPTAISLPRDVVLALSAAVRECVRNAAQHSGADEASVTVRRSGFALSIAVRDDGRGFDHHLVSGRLGLRESVVARMADIDGSARVVSAEGRGTTVYLRWSPIPSHRLAPREIGGGAVADLFPSVAQIIFPMLVQGLWVAALLGHLVTAPALSIAATLAVVAVGVWALRRGMSAGLRGWQSVLLGVTAWSATLISSLSLPLGPAHPRLLWLVVTATAISSVASLFRPLREAVIIGLGIALLLVLSLTARHPGSSLVPFVTVLLSPMVVTGVAIVIRRLVDRCAFEIWTNEERMRDVGHGMTGNEFFAAQLDHRLLGSKSALIEFLDDIVADPTILDSAHAQAHAARLERSLRDVIALTVDPLLGAEMTRVRLAGWSLRSRWVEDVPADIQRVLAGALAQLPAPPAAARQVPTVTVTASHAHIGWRLSLLAHPAYGAWVADFDPGAPWQVQREDTLHAVALVSGSSPDPDLASASGAAAQHLGSHPGATTMTRGQE